MTSDDKQLCERLWEAFPDDQGDELLMTEAAKRIKALNARLEALQGHADALAEAMTEPLPLATPAAIAALANYTAYLDAGEKE